MRSAPPLHLLISLGALLLSPVIVLANPPPAPPASPKPRAATPAPKAAATPAPKAAAAPASKVATPAGDDLPQGVTFVGPPAAATITIGGLVANPSRYVGLGPGSYEYTVHAPGWCPATGKVDVPAGKRVEIKVDAKKWLFPQVFFAVNKHKIQVTAAGKPIPRATWVTLEGRCGGVVPYKAWLYKQVQTGEIAIRPGVKVKIDIKLLDPESVRALVRLARSQRQGHRAAVNYALSVPTGAHQDLNLLNTAEGRWWWNLDFVRLGGGVGVGFGNGFAIEAFGSAILQMTDLGNSQPMHIQGLVTLVPFLGLEMGLGYQKLTDIAGTDRDNFRGAGDSILTNIGVLRALAGVTIPVTPLFAAEVRLSYNVNMARLLQIGVGLSFALP